VSGGSFNYLYHKLDDGYIEGTADADAMVEWLKEKGMIGPANELRDYFHRPAPSKELIALVKAVEWFQSNDWHFDDVIEAYDAWMGDK